MEYISPHYMILAEYFFHRTFMTAFDPFFLRTQILLVSPYLLLLASHTTYASENPNGSDVGVRISKS